MTRSRAFNRFHRWTAKVRRRHLKDWLPEGHDGEMTLAAKGSDRRQEAALRDALREIQDPLALEESLQAGSAI